MAHNNSALVPSQRLRIAYLLALVGGYLDAYTYVLRGGVFANAQTGNIIKLGIAFCNGASDTYLLFLLPIMFFAAGIFCAKLIDDALTKRQLRLVRRAVLAVEMLGLIIVGLIPLGEGGNTLANCIVSFVAALQYEAFTTFRGEAIVTTMTTGNLRKFLDALYDGTMRHDPGRLRSAAVFFAVIIVFATGAYLGTAGCDLMGRAAVVPPIVCLGLAIAIITIMRRRPARG